MRIKAYRLVMFAGATLLALAANLQPCFSQDAPTGFDTSLIEAKGNYNLVYQMKRIDKSPQEFRDAQIEMNKKRVAERLKNGSINAEKAQKILIEVNSAFQNQQQVRTSTVTIWSSPQGFQYSARQGKQQSEVVIGAGKTLAREDSVIYLHKGANTQRLVEMPPLPVNFGDVKLICPGTRDDDPDSILYLNPGSSSGAARGPYREGHIVWEKKEGVPLVRRIYFGDPSRPIQEILYTGHRKVQGVFLPSKIVLRHNSGIPHKQGTLVPISESVYTLVSATNQVPVDVIKKKLALKTGDFIQNDDGSTVQSFTYDASRSIEQQHAVAFREQQRIEQETQRYKYSRQMNGGVLITLAGFALLAFVILRRSKMRRNAIP